MPVRICIVLYDILRIKRRLTWRIWWKMVWI